MFLATETQNGKCVLWREKTNMLTHTIFYLMSVCIKRNSKFFQIFLHHWEMHPNTWVHWPWHSCAMVQESMKTWTSASSSSLTVITAGLLGFPICFYSYLYLQISFPFISNWKAIPPRYIVRECFVKIFGFDKLAFSKRKAFSETACQNLIKTCVPRDK